MVLLALKINKYRNLYQWYISDDPNIKMIMVQKSHIKLNHWTVSVKT